MRLIDADALMKIYADRMSAVAERYSIDSSECGILAGAMKLLETQPTIEQPMQWIPVTERLPERSGNYLITRDIIEGYEKEACSIDYFEADTLDWDGYGNLVIAWMPLPKAYEVTE